MKKSMIVRYWQSAEMSESPKFSYRLVAEEGAFPGSYRVRLVSMMPADRNDGIASNDRSFRAQGHEDALRQMREIVNQHHSSLHPSDAAIEDEE